MGSTPLDASDPDAYRPGPLPGQSRAEYDAIRAYAKSIADKAPPPTPELIARLRPIFTAHLNRDGEEGDPLTA